MELKINQEMLRGARKQFCLDIGMDYEEYEQNPNKKSYIVKSKYKEGTTQPGTEGARIYAGSDSFFWATICMGQLFLCVDEQIYDWAVEEFSECAPEWFCEYGNLRKIEEKLKEYGRKIGDTHVYFLPCDSAECKVEQERQKVTVEVKTQPVVMDYEWYEQEEILRFKEKNRFDRAICFSPTQPDVLAVAAMRPMSEATTQPEGITQSQAMKQLEDMSQAKTGGNAVEKDFDQSHMAGMAGVSEDGKYLWQIGINVDADYRGKGLAAELVRMLKEEVIRRGKIPFYGTSESHIISQTVGLKAGFVPAFTSIYVKEVTHG